MYIENPDALISWLINYIEPLCDAAPQALAKYIMALIKKNMPEDELKTICLDRLDVFLTKETKPFVDVLFNVLANKSYLKSNDNFQKNNFDTNEKNYDNKKSRSRSRSPKNQEFDFEGRRGNSNIDVSNNLNNNTARNNSNEDRSRKKNLLLKDNTRKHGSFKNEYRDSQNEQSSSSSRSRTPTKNRARRSRSKSQPRDNKKLKSTLRSPNNTDLKENNHNVTRRRCRDYDEKGLCMRGLLCQFDHGEDPVVVDQMNTASLALSASNVNNALLPTPNNFCNNTSAIAEPYNPEAPAMDAQSKRNFNISIMPKYSNKLTSQSTQKFWPNGKDQMKSNNVSVQANNFTSKRSRELVDLRARDNCKPTISATNFNNSNVSSNSSNSMNTNNTNNSSNLNNSNNEMLNNMKRGISRRGRGGFRPTNNKNRRPVQVFTNNGEEKTTLEVRKIPANLNTISHLNEHFSKFGTITNLQVGYEGDAEAALVQFSSNNEALAAYRSTEAILNNRFIKVFWHSTNINNNSQTGMQNKEKSEELSDSANTDKMNIGKKRLSRSETEESSGVAPKDNIVYNLLSNSLIANGPNQLASLGVVSPKPVFNPALLKKQYGTSSTSLTGSLPTSNASGPMASSQTVVTKPAQPSKEKLMQKIELQKKRQEILSLSMQQQKLLLLKLKTVKTEKEKYEIRNTLNLLSKKIRTLDLEVKKDSKTILAETNLIVNSAV